MLPYCFSYQNQFIKPEIAISFSGDNKTDGNIIANFKNILALVTKHLDRYNGHLRQFIVDDKGAIIIATFGLRGTVMPNMVSDSGLPATMAIHKDLFSELGVQSKIGATYGKAYCGVVGGKHRLEYAILGPAVNLAARLMACSSNPGCLVDGEIFKRVGEKFTFKPLKPIQAKGYSELVQLYEPFSRFEFQDDSNKFVGRFEMLHKILEFVDQPHSERLAAPQILFISGMSGMGKTFGNLFLC